MKYIKGTFVVVPQIYDLVGMSATSQALFMWLCVYANELGQCYPSRKKLAKNLSCSIRTVDASLNELIEQGFLKKENRISGNQKQTNLYQIHILSGGGSVEPMDFEQMGISDVDEFKFRGGVVQILHEGGANSAHRTISNELYPPIIPQRGMVKKPISTENEYSQEFETFWKLYPNKKAKFKAYQAWLKLNPGGELVEKICSAVEIHKQTDQWMNDGGIYIPHGASWLNGRRWEDEITLENNNEVFIAH